MNSKYLIATGTIAALLTASPVFADSHGQKGHGFINLDDLIHTSVQANASDTSDQNDNDHDSKGLGARVHILAQNQDNSSSSHGIGSFVSALAHSFNHNWKDNDNDGDDHHHATSTPATTTPSTVQGNITGAVSSISGSTITLAGKNGAVYTVNAGTTTISGGAQAHTLADVKVGDTLVVRGTLSGSVVTATKITDKAFVNKVISASDSLRAGIVTAVSSTGLTLQGFGTNSTTSVTTNGSTTVLMKGGATTTGAIATGTKVLAFGTTSTSTPDTFVASVI